MHMYGLSIRLIQILNPFVSKLIFLIKSKTENSYQNDSNINIENKIETHKSTVSLLFVSSTEIGVLLNAVSALKILKHTYT